MRDRLLDEMTTAYLYGPNGARPEKPNPFDGAAEENIRLQARLQMEDILSAIESMATVTMNEPASVKEGAAQ
jgi:hypothetical protein